MIDTIEFERDAAAVENDFPVTFVFNGSELTGCKDESIVGLAIANAGYDARHRTRLVCRLSIFPGAAPVSNDLITLEDQLWRVEIPEYSPDGINVTLPLVQSS